LTWSLKREKEKRGVSGQKYVFIRHTSLDLVFKERKRKESDAGTEIHVLTRHTSLDLVLKAFPVPCFLLLQKNTLKSRERTICFSA
jgi:hypothetical protein